MGIYLYHYSLFFPHQVIGKCSYYSKAMWAQRNQAEQWASMNYLTLSRRFKFHNASDHFSWLERYNGKHPEEIYALMTDIKINNVQTPLRETKDIEVLLGKFSYRLMVLLLKCIVNIQSTKYGYRIYTITTSGYTKLKQFIHNLSL